MKKKITYLSPFFPKKFRKYIKERIRQKEIKAYTGDNVFCPICESKFRVFANYGVDNRENARCLDCNSMERHRLLWKYLNGKKEFEGNMKFSMLHFAPQRKFLSKFSENQNIDYTPCDLNPETYEYFNIDRIHKVDVLNIPFEDNSFDVVICNHVLEHVDDYIVAMKELFRVMRKGGWGVFQVPIDYSLKTSYEDETIIDPKEREKAYGQWDHLRMFGCDYKDKLASVGFNVTEDNYINSFSDDEIKRFGLLKTEFIYLCEKPI